MSSHEQAENPLIEALPPATDYLTYLTIVEYNLTKERLDSFHKILQDVRLTTNIGWDLVHILLPLLPESGACLIDVARLGNPREVILKVTEILESFEDQDEAISRNEDQIVDHADLEHSPEPRGSRALSQSEQQVSRFGLLLRMLCILQPRVKTKYPSRFLSTSLQAVASAYSALASNGLATMDVLSFIKTISLLGRPQLPPRPSADNVPTFTSLASADDPPAPDPEDEQTSVSAEEKSIQKDLLLTFVTHAMRSYVESLPSLEGKSCLAWTARYIEKQQPERIIPGLKSLGARFREEEELIERDNHVARVLTIAKSNLALTMEDFLQIVVESRKFIDAEEGFFPSTNGVLYYIAAYLLQQQDSPRSEDSIIRLSLKDHSQIVTAFSEEAISNPSIRDSLFILGWAILRSDNDYTCFEDYEAFFSYLQQLVCILDGPEAHNYVATILHSNPNARHRYDFIDNTLEWVPFDHVKAYAVDWFRDEILDAFDLSNRKTGVAQYRRTSSEPNVFKDVHRFSHTCRQLFIEPIVPLESQSGTDTDIAQFNSLIPYFTRASNLVYLLLSNRKLRDALHTAELDHLLYERYIKTMKGLCKEFKAAFEDESAAAGDQSLQLDILEFAIKRAECASSEAVRD